MRNLNFINTLKKIRKEKNFTQKQIADFLCISERAYQHYEYGEREPNIDNLIKISDYFNISIDYLLGRTDKPEINK